MFKWLRRQPSAPRSRVPGGKPPPRAVPQAGGPAADPAPPPLPEVVGEGNTHADWSAWEDSMTALDSQLQSIAPADRVHVRDTRPSQLDDIDPFSGVRGRR